MRFRSIAHLGLILFVFAVIAPGCATPNGSSVEDRRKHVMRMHDDALADLHARDPYTKELIAESAGYGVFSQIGTNVLLVTTEGGFGVLIDKESDKKMYMRMAGAGVGVGIGAKDVRLVFIFRNQQAIEDFMSGKWTVGADADAAAKASDTGGELSGTAKTGNVQIYTLTKNGLALSATVSGTRFYIDRELTEPVPEPATPQTASTSD